MDSNPTQLNFLKNLILQTDWEESRRMLGRIHQAEQQELASRRRTIVLASGIAGWWLAVALVTRGWAWVWRQPEHPVAVLLMWMGGIALFTLLLVCGCWLWHRSTLRRVVGDTQRFLAGWLASHHPPVSQAEFVFPIRNRRARMAGSGLTGAASRPGTRRFAAARCQTTRNGSR